MNLNRVGVIGGGAAGFFGAIACAEADPHARVTILEAGQHVLSKVLISGGGRCNVTHACFDPALLVQQYPRGGKALRGAFSRFQPSDTVEWFKRHQVKLKIEADGRMFPITNEAATIADCLIYATQQAGVELRTRVAVVGVAHTESGFHLKLRSGEILSCDRLLLATGSNRQGHQLAQALGHTIVPPVPSLFTFNISDAPLRQLAGISVNQVQLKLRCSDGKPWQQTGPLLITHWGLSGPAVLKLSAWGARVLHDHRYQADVQINWLPQLHAEGVRQMLLATKAEWPNRAIASQCPFPLARRLWQYLVNRAQINPAIPWTALSKKALNQLIQELTQGHYAMQGKGVFKEEFVTCGGVSLREINFKTMASRCCANLYFAGEILDIDGVTGGFNFQSAWTTGWLAGRAMGEGDRS
ncbi:MAG: NAD(P)/FAD-dependent oxidoreductase [Cyanothece sp. SIO1E1]|nr:NAD(P)/FAD-dependent oxidoreductase [Cyanothece sp. SIO1E1]